MATVLSKRLKLWFAAAAVALIASFALRYVAISNVGATTRQAGDIREALEAMDSVVETLEDAQAGQVDYLLTGHERYMKAYQQARAAVADQLDQVAELIDSNPIQSGRMEELRQAASAKLSELNAATERRGEDGLQAAQKLLEADIGAQLNHRAENIVAAMKAHERKRFDQNQQKGNSAEQLNLVNFVGLLGFNLLLLGLLFYAVRVDAAQRAQAKTVLERQELRLRRVVESNVIGIVLSKGDGQLFGANDAFLQMLGYRREELDAGVIQRALINAPEYTERTDQAMAEVRRTGKCAPYKKEYVRKDGSRVPVLVGVASIDDEAGQLVLFILDLTEHHEAEAARAKLVAIVESSNDAIISCSIDGVITTWNHGAERLFGYGPADIIGRPLADLVPRDAEAEQAYLLQRIRRGERVERLETLRVAKGGRPINVSVTIFPLRDGSGQVAGAAEIVHDITAHKQAEIERERLLAAERTARAEAERIGHVKDEFLATLSHELRTPLNVILGWIHLLTTSRMGPEETAQALEIIRRSARSQAQLIEDLLDMSRIVSGKLRMDMQRVELVSIIDAAIESVRPAAEAKGVRLIKTLDPAGGSVLGDPNRLQQIVWNLLSNAVKFTPKGGRVQTLLSHAHGHVEIEVNDTGQGIPREFLPHVFERFRQADASTTRRHTGLGLGLAIVRHLIELHGGSVIVESAGEGRGASFTVALPALEPEETPLIAVALPATALSLENPIAGRPRLSGVKVLVVDDERESRELVRRLLEDCEASVITAASASEALVALRRNRPTVLLSDIGMPEEDGYSLIRHVRQLPANEGGQTPAAALTAFARGEDRARTLSSGYQIHLSKPVEPSALLAAVASLAGRPAPDEFVHLAN
jgi:PAS domain S-box-containing protein